jgi:hypothetical protein
MSEQVYAVGGGQVILQTDEAHQAVCVEIRAGAAGLRVTLRRGREVLDLWALRHTRRVHYLSGAWPADALDLSIAMVT